MTVTVGVTCHPRTGAYTSQMCPSDVSDDSAGRKAGHGMPMMHGSMQEHAGMVQMQPDAACAHALVGLMAHAIAEGISAGMTKALSVLDATLGTGHAGMHSGDANMQAAAESIGRHAGTCNGQVESQQSADSTLHAGNACKNAAGGASDSTDRAECMGMSQEHAHARWPTEQRSAAQPDAASLTLAGLVGAQSHGELSSYYGHLVGSTACTHAAHTVNGMGSMPCGLRSNATAESQPAAACMAACMQVGHRPKKGRGQVSQPADTTGCGGVHGSQGKAAARAVQPGCVLVGSVPCALIEPGKPETVGSNGPHGRHHAGLAGKAGSKSRSVAKNSIKQLKFDAKNSNRRVDVSDAKNSVKQSKFDAKNSIRPSERSSCGGVREQGKLARAARNEQWTTKSGRSKARARCGWPGLPKSGRRTVNMIDGRVQVSVTLRECKADFVGRTRSPGTKSKVQVKSDARAAEPLSVKSTRSADVKADDKIDVRLETVDEEDTEVSSVDESMRRDDSASQPMSRKSNTTPVPWGDRDDDVSDAETQTCASESEPDDDVSRPTDVTAEAAAAARAPVGYKHLDDGDPMKVILEVTRPSVGCGGQHQHAASQRSSARRWSLTDL